MLHTRLQTLLHKRSTTHCYRHIKSRNSPPSIHVVYGKKSCLSFCSNDYLGLANHKKVIHAFKKAVDLYGVGSGSSPIVSGTCKIHTELEEALAAFMQFPKALLFSTGYMANLGIINAITERQDTIFYDRSSHASLIDGVLLSQAKSIRYAHNDMADLERRLIKHTHSNHTQTFIVSNGVSSSTGNITHLPELIKVAKHHNAWLILDDAHGIGCLGLNGRGTLEHHHVDAKNVNILVGTLGKALGTFGAFAAGDKIVIDALQQTTRTHMFSTALPPAIAAATLESLAILHAEPERRKRLHENIAYFIKCANTLNLPLLPSTTPIQSLRIGSSQAAKTLSEHLLDEHGLLVKSFRPPTVPPGKSLLRIVLSSEHTKSHIDCLLSALKQKRALQHD